MNPLRKAVIDVTDHVLYSQRQNQLFLLVRYDVTPTYVGGDEYYCEMHEFLRKNYEMLDFRRVSKGWNSH